MSNKIMICLEFVLFPFKVTFIVIMEINNRAYLTPNFCLNSIKQQQIRLN